ncbi:MAG: adenosylcobinamide-GDP ribazoletransferase [Alphaproteobacteria bacterium]|jgi:adenosylcobinamide-GDP ribazoletransferase|nr:adenosylcobinamide-GDP ribazoletransferase [Rhodospirillaceae bacterium]MBT6202721.1 adenosylcobinamide-GDP ribazoletransferase [Rhodospirillaceae bacterium]MBT7614680.1 adenosylcobinamide-GDP ribazoletransferase [Rhodospirillaceae bacterium]MDG2479559.1 adenosylcobinamide-GDP ribazoletransferase [Alphaproteobacteria bacterium]
MADDDAQPDWFARIRVATAFLTRLPVECPDDVPLARTVAVFPLVGAGVGLIGGLAYMLAHWIGLDPWLSAVFAVLTTIVLTGALHEDGIADVADGFGVHGERQRKLDAMRDSRIGAFGVIALVLVLAARIGALAALALPEVALVALIAAGTLSRANVVVAMRMMPLARKDGLGAGAGIPAFTDTVTALILAGALLFALLFPWTWAPALLLGCCAACLMARAARRAFGGQTGDVLGAIQQVTEIGVLAAVVAAY